MLQIFKIVKTQQSTQNYITPDDEQKYGRKRLGQFLYHLDPTQEK